MPSIVVAVDFSVPSRKAVDEAAKLARLLGSRLVLVHAFSQRTGDAVAASRGHPDPITKVQLDIDADEAVTLSTQWAGALRDAGLEVETTTKHGKVHEVVLEQARKSKAPFVVVGSHGRTGLKRAVLGSVAETIVRHADRPVLVVPA